MEVEVLSGPQDDRPAQLVTAISTAWTTYRLYPNPLNQPPFERAVAVLADLHDPSLVLELGAGVFVSRGKEIATGRDAADRLATAFYVHDVESIRFRDPPSGDDLVELFSLLDADDAQVRDRGGLERLLHGKGVASITIRQRGLLRRATEEDGAGDAVEEGTGNTTRRRSAVAALVVQGAAPEEVAERLLTDADGDHSLVAKWFLEAYEEIHQLEDDDTGSTPAPARWDPREWLRPYWTEPIPPPPIETFIDTFFCLPADARVCVLEMFLPHLGEGSHRMFVDQFAGHELADLVSALDPAAYDKLLTYARDVADAGGGEMTELLPLLNSAREVKSERRDAAERTYEMLRQLEEDDGLPELFEELRQDLSPGAARDLGLGALRGLFECEARPARFERLLRIWTGRIAAYAREGDFENAYHLVAAVQHDPTYGREKAPLVEEALERLLAPDLLGVLVRRYMESDRSDYAARLFEAFGAAMVTRLLNQLADEEQGSVRRMLVDVLAAVGRSHLHLLLPRLRDQRWYVVRNLATVLGKTGRADVVAPLQSLLKHSEARVRAEALRALAGLQGKGAVAELLAALTDPHERVREAALVLIASSDIRSIENELLAVLRDGAIPVADKRQIAELLAARAGPDARAALKKLASRQVVLRPGRRSARHAARTVLREES